MSPLPRPGPRASALLGVSLVFVMAFLAAFGMPAGAQGDGNQTTDGGNTTADGNATTGDGTTDGATDGTTDDGAAGGDGAAADGSIPRRFTVRAYDAPNCTDDRANCWDVETLVVTPGDHVVVTVDLTPSVAPHNFHVEDPIGVAVPERGFVTEQVLTLEFDIPENMAEPIVYICDAHPDTMVGVFTTQAQLAASGGGHESVPQMGVHFLAYWVGVIAFALLFIVYGATFFLFKYNETPATTDHWDRSGNEARDNKGLGRFAGLLAVVIAVAALAGILYIALLR